MMVVGDALVSGGLMFLYVCMVVCMCACMHVCMYVCRNYCNTMSGW